MTATGYGYGALQTGISLGTTFNGLADGATAETAALAFPLVTGSTAGYPYLANLLLVMSAAITPAAGSPNIQGVFVAADDGTNYPGYGVSNSQLFPIDRTAFTIPLIPSVAVAVIRASLLVLPPVLSTAANPKLVLFNNSGVAFAATVTATLFPLGGDIG